MNLNIPIFDFIIPAGDSIEFEFGRIENMPGIIKAEQLPHRHNFYEILWVSEGEGTQYIDFKGYTIKAPVVYFLSSEQVHYWEIKKKVKGYAFLFTANFFLQDSHSKALLDFPFFHSSAQAPVLKPDKALVADLQVLGQQIAREYTNHGIARETILRSYLNILLAKFLAGFTEQHPVLLHDDKGEWAVRKLKLAINEHFLTEKSPAIYAERLNISTRHLASIVKKITGKTTTGLISDRVVLEAKRLLQYSDSSIAEIAYYLGFETPTYFGRFFRKITGITPGQFQKKIAAGKSSLRSKHL
ncbi:MAG TPA: helix-turn-helix transcriptional regulator [Ohtaekwangia sp.]|uniref:helix-turn-helix transcriptional regulator n=1 Tax=Ohtaekwangia sp. TaxID=2066019 RepID=UPI002F93813F